jgi:galactokinase
MKTMLKERALSAFAEAYGEGEPRLFAASGRVNLIGEHTDYNDGFVLPMPIGRATIVAARPIAAARIEVFAANLGERDAFDIDRPIEHSQSSWANYVRGVAVAMLDEGLSLGGTQLAIFGDLPLGSGLSSSASLEIAVGRALAALSGLNIPPRRLALIARAAENDFAGCPSGIMDQLVVAEGESGAALLIDCRSLQTQTVALPADVDVLIVESGERHVNVGGGYVERREQCEAAARALGATALRDVEPDQLQAAQAALDPILFRRARHVVTENHRVLQAVAALRAGDLHALGALLVQSHASMRDDFEITTPRIDAVADFLNERLASEGGGARMTGGGFGGCVIAVGRRPNLAGLSQSLAEQGVTAFLASS